MSASRRPGRLAAGDCAADAAGGGRTRMKTAPVYGAGRPRPPACECATLTHFDRELTMAMLDDVAGRVAPDAEKLDRTVQPRRRLRALSLGRGFALVLLCAGAVLVTS